MRPGDRLSKPASDRIADGDKITVSYAKPVTLAVDGKVTDHTVYDRTVGDAFDTLGVEAPAGAYLSAKKSSVIPRKGAQLVVSSSKSLTVIADKKKQTITSSAPTVEAVLKKADVTLDSDDEVKPGRDAFVKPDAEAPRRAHQEGHQGQRPFRSTTRSRSARILRLRSARRPWSGPARRARRARR